MLERTSRKLERKNLEEGEKSSGDARRRSKQRLK